MRAKLKRLHSPDAPDLKRYRPEDPVRFGLLVQAMIGPEAGEREESFDFVVCTPAWLEDRLRSERFRFGRHHVLVAEHDYRLIESAIRDLCDRTTGSDWLAIANVLGRYGHWEFEDYTPAAGDLEIGGL
jgi:hypothetical protein